MHKKLRVFVTGSTGQLGQSIQSLAKNYPQIRFQFISRKTLELTNSQSIDAYFSGKLVDVIVNCAAYTAVDQAELEPELADNINHVAVKQLAHIAKEKNAALVHVSSDYVFNGHHFKPYQEDDVVCPHNVYGQTKLKGEDAILKVNPKGCIIRTSWLYSEFGNNFVKTMMKLGKDNEQLGIIFDQVGSPTYAKDLAKAIIEIIKSDSFPNNFNQMFHFSNEGVCSWYDFAREIFELSHIDCRVNPIETKDYPTLAKRPHYSLLNKAKIKAEFGLQIPHWKESLKDCIEVLRNGNG